MSESRRRNGGPDRNELRDGLVEELSAVLSAFGVQAEAMMVQGAPTQDPLRVLVQEVGGGKGQLRIYSAAPELSRHLIDASAVRAHLASRAPDRVLEPVLSSGELTITRNDAHHLYLRIPAGTQPIPPAWDLVTLVQLGTCFGELSRASERFRSWRHAPSRSEWLKALRERVARVHRVADPAAGYHAVLPESISERLQRVGELYTSIAESDAAAAEALVDTYDSAVWEAAGARGFVLDPPPPADLFLGSDRRICIAWPERARQGLIWDGMLGEIALRRVTEDLDAATEAILASHRVAPISADLVKLLEIEASPVRPFLRVVEGAVADAPVRREELLAQLIDRHFADPEGTKRWRDRLANRIREKADQA
ncbi:MAG: hypothetical protein CME06_10885 [Gemmatimonadetes bacterium]|nr:hypothetical protein [Gemmatimonadota bacterium]